MTQKPAQSRFSCNKVVVLQLVLAASSVLVSSCAALTIADPAPGAWINEVSGASSGRLSNRVQISSTYPIRRNGNLLDVSHADGGRLSSIRLGARGDVMRAGTPPSSESSSSQPVDVATSESIPDVAALPDDALVAGTPMPIVEVKIQGTILGVVHGDPIPGTGGAPATIFTLLQDSGAIVRFRLAPSAPFDTAWTRVELNGVWISPSRLFEVRRAAPLPFQEVSITGDITRVEQSDVLPSPGGELVTIFTLRQESGLSIDFRLAPSTPFNFELKRVMVTGTWIFPRGRVLFQARLVVPLP